MKKTAVVVAILLATAVSLPLLNAQAVNPYPSGNPTESSPLTASQLQALVAPIALYPDSLVAQVLTAATFPDQVAIASYWMQENKGLTGSALMQSVDQQSWNAAVKGLTEFPSVLDNMATNLSWTSSLGEAYHNQQTEVMNAIQTCRAQAKAAGNLNSSSQIKVEQQSPEVIVIQPANPQIVYVPQYNPAVIYGVPYVVPAYVAPVYTPGEVAAASMMSFGVGVAVGAMMHGGCCAWGYSSWNCGWHGTAVVYHGGAYYGNPAYHGGYYGGAYHSSYGYGNAYSHNYTDYDHSSYNSYHNVSGNTVNVNSADKSSWSNSWSQHSGGSSAFSGYGGHSGSGGGYGGDGGWSSRADSSRGWGSMRSSGFSGGRFGGFGGSGGGRFGGFRR
jgi:hypothetical protein